VNFRLKFNAGWVLALIVLATPDHALVAADPLCRASVQALAVNNQTVLNSKFTTDRDLDDYKFHFGDPFQEAIKKRVDGAIQTWIDLGAGHAIAMRDFLKHDQGTILHGAWKGVAVGVELPKDEKFSTDVVRIREKGGSDAFHYRTGFFADIPAAELPQADLITDYFGALSYTHTLSSDLQRALTLLKPGGKLIVTMIPRSFGLRVRGEEVLFPDFVYQIAGVRLETQLNEFGTPSYTIVRTEGPVRVPELVLTNMRNGKPPHRDFELAESERGALGKITTTNVADEHQRIIERYRASDN